MSMSVNAARFAVSQAAPETVEVRVMCRNGAADVRDARMASAVSSQGQQAPAGFVCGLRRGVQWVAARSQALLHAAQLLNESRRPWIDMHGLDKAIDYVADIPMAVGKFVDIAKLLAQQPAADQEEIVALTHQYLCRTPMNRSVIPHLIAALGKVPAALTGQPEGFSNRQDVARWASQIITHVTLSSDTVIILKALADEPAASRGSLVHAVQNLCAAPAMQWETAAITQSLAEVAAPQRAALLSYAQQLLDHGVSAALIAAALFELTMLEAAEQAEMTTFCLAIWQHESNPMAQESALFQILATPHARRAQECERLLRNAPQPRNFAAHRDDMESTMKALRVHLTSQALKRLNAALPQAINMLDQLAQLRTYLQAGLQADSPASPRRAGGTAWEHALRTLDAPKREGDLSPAIRFNPVVRLEDGKAVRLGHVCALVWVGIHRQPEAEREALRRELVRALEQCIEDDGHRVCKVGLAERLAGVLHDHYYADLRRIDAPTGADLVSILCENFCGKHPAPTPEQLRDFAEDARQCAQANFAQYPQELEVFRHHFDTIIGAWDNYFPRGDAAAA